MKSIEKIKIDEKKVILKPLINYINAVLKDKEFQENVVEDFQNK